MSIDILKEIYRRQRAFQSRARRAIEKERPNIIVSSHTDHPLGPPGQLLFCTVTDEWYVCRHRQWMTAQKFVAQTEVSGRRRRSIVPMRPGAAHIEQVSVFDEPDDETKVVLETLARGPVRAMASMLGQPALHDTKIEEEVEEDLYAVLERGSGAIVQVEYRLLLPAPAGKRRRR